MLSTIVVPPEISAALAAVIAAVLTAIAAAIRSSGQSKKPATNEDVMKRLDDIDAGIKKLDDRALGDHDILMRLLERRR